MNILTTNGLVGRYVTDWAGAEARILKIAIRLGVPNYPGDTMTLSGSVARVGDDGSIEVSIRGREPARQPCHRNGDREGRRRVSAPLSGATAIAGIGATEFSKESGRSELQLCLEACKAALDDAGIAPRDVDGLVTFSMDSSPSIMVGRGLGVAELRYFSLVDYGGGAACATVAHAAAAITAGLADIVVCYRAFNERSGRRFGSGDAAVQARGESPMAQHFGYYSPTASSLRPRGSPWPRAAICMPTEQRPRTSGVSPWRRALTQRRTPRPGSTTVRSPWPTTRARS